MSLQEHFNVIIIFLDLHTSHFNGSYTGATQRLSPAGEALFIFPSSLYLFFFFDDLEEDQKQTEGLGRSDADREIIRQWETKELLIICSDRSDNLTCEYRLTENKLRRWHRAVATDIRRPAPRCNPFTTTCMASSCLFHALLHPDTVENVNVSVNFWGDGARSSGSGDHRRFCLSSWLEKKNPHFCEQNMSYLSLRLPSPDCFYYVGGLFLYLKISVEGTNHFVQTAVPCLSSRVSGKQVSYWIFSFWKWEHLSAPTGTESAFVEVSFARAEPEPEVILEHLCFGMFCKSTNHSYFSLCRCL